MRFDCRSSSFRRALKKTELNEIWFVDFLNGCLLFGEGGGRIVLTCRPEHEGRIPTATRIGVVGGDRVEVRVGGMEVSIGVDEARRAYERGLPEALA